MNIFFILYLVCVGFALVGVFNSQWGRIVPRKTKTLLVVAVIIGAVVDFFLWGGNNSNSFNINVFS